MCVHEGVCVSMCRLVLSPSRNHFQFMFSARSHFPRQEACLALDLYLHPDKARGCARALVHVCVCVQFTKVFLYGTFNLFELNMDYFTDVKFYYKFLSCAFHEGKVISISLIKRTSNLA